MLPEGFDCHYKYAQSRELIGKGMAADVYKIEIKERDYVMKVFKNDCPEEFRHEYLTAKELKILKCKNILKMRKMKILWYFLGKEIITRMCIIYPYYNYDLYDYLILHHWKNQDNSADDDEKMDIHNCVKILKNILYGLEYLHNNNYIHGDIKPANILLDSPDHVVLADIGSIHKSPRICGPGTVDYKSPECLLMLNYDYSADIWSFGVIAFEIMTLEKLIDTPRLNNRAYSRGLKLGNYEYNYSGKNIIFNEDDILISNDPVNTDDSANTDDPANADDSNESSSKASDVDSENFDIIYNIGAISNLIGNPPEYLYKYCPNYYNDKQIINVESPRNLREYYYSFMETPEETEDKIFEIIKSCIQWEGRITAEEIKKYLMST